MSNRQWILKEKNKAEVERLMKKYDISKICASVLSNRKQVLEGESIESQSFYDSFQIKKSGLINKVFEIYLDLIDEAGGIATVATILASNNLSIKNIGIIHNREFEEGVLRLEMYDQESLDRSTELLKKYHYTVYER